MLPKAKRLSKHHYEGVLVHTKGRIQTPHLSLRVVRLSKHTEKSRFACITSAKVAKKAHERNSLRRRGYAALEDLSPTLPKGLAFQIHFKKNANRLSKTQIQAEINELLKQFLNHHNE